MKKIFLLFILTITMINSQINVPEGNRIIMDGIISPGEWEDALELKFQGNHVLNASIKLKQDSKNLLILYIIENFADSTLVFPEIFVNSENDKSEKWESDDLWFHVSAQDCFFAGARENYSGCKVNSEKWSAVPNYPFGNNWQRIEKIEISIPLTLMNVKTDKEFGICFSLMIFPADKRFNIPSGAHEDKPASWGRYIIKD